MVQKPTNCNILPGLILSLLILLLSFGAKGQSAIWLKPAHEESQAQSILKELVADHPEKDDFRFVLFDSIAEGNRKMLRFRQEFGGFPIPGSDIRVHLENERIWLVNGNLAHNFAMTSPGISYEQARSIAEAFKSCRMADQKPKTIWVLSEAEQGYRLCYELNAQCSDLPDKGLIHVDAYNGLVIGEFPMADFCHSRTASAPLLYNSGFADINILEANGVYQLIDTCRSNEDKPVITMTGHGSNPVEIFSTENNDWSIGANRAAAQCHWGTALFFDYLMDAFGRHSWDDQGGRMLSVLDSSNASSAGFSYYGMYALYGPGSINPNHFWVSLDVVGHEWTHPILFHEGVLLWTNEGRAIAEGICDIFGVVHEFNTEAKFDSLKNGDWAVAEDLDGGKIRDLRDPQTMGMTDTYNSSLYNTTGNKYERSAPLGYWFYLLSEGGSGQNDHISNPYRYRVSAIGMNKAIRVLYRSITHYLTGMSEYRDLRLATQQAAEDLYGPCSREFKSVVEAWKAIGVYNGISYCQMVSIDDRDLNQVSIYPNPGNGNFRIELDETLEVNSVSVMNTEGVEVYHSEVESRTIDLNLKALSSGVFILKLIGKEKVLSRKLVIN